MKVICGKEELLKGSQIVQTIVSPRSTLPILSNFLFETDGQKIKLSSTDLEVGVTCLIKAEIVREGSITIPAKRFGDIIRELPDDKEIEIKADEGNQINIRCGKSHFILMGLSKNDYPVLPKFPEEKTFKIAKDKLKAMLHRTSYAVSMDETRYVLNGVYLVVEEGDLLMVATDGRRLAYVRQNGIIDKSIEYKIIIPIKTVNEVQRILSSQESNDEILIGITENQIAFKIDSITVISRLVEGIFPNYEQVIPKKHDRQISLNLKETHSAVKQMSLLTADKTSNIKFYFGKNTLRVSASTQGLGSGEVELDIEHPGTNLEIAFNPQFLIDIFKNLDGDEFYIELTNPLTPALIRPKSDKDYLCVIMPVRT